MDLSRFKSEGGADFEPAPAGVHNAVCYAVIDLGTQEGSYMGKPKIAPKIQLRWEIDERREDGKRFIIVRSYTASMHEKASLRHHLEAWRGLAFKDADLQPGGFSMRKLLGAGCQIQIVHNEKEGGGVYGNIAAIMKLGKGMKPLTPEIEPFMIDLESPQTFDREAYAMLSETMQLTIAKSPEYQALMGRLKAPAKAANGAHAPTQKPPVVHTDDLDDEIPFELPRAA